MPRAGAAAPPRKTLVPPPRLHRDESGTDRGDTEGPGNLGAPGKEKKASRKGRRAEGRFSPTPPRHFAPGWGEALPSPGDVKF